MLDEDMTRAMSAEPPELPHDLTTRNALRTATQSWCVIIYAIFKNIALYQQTGNQRLQSQLHLSHIAPQLAWVGVPVPMAEPSYAPPHVVTPSTTTLAAAVVRSIQSS